MVLLCVARSLWLLLLTSRPRDGPLYGGRKYSSSLPSICLHDLCICRMPTSYGIFKFKQDQYSISSTVMPDTLQVSPAGDMATVVVVSLDKMFVYVSRNFGQSWDRFKSPTSNFDPTKDLYLSNFSPLNMVILSNMGEVRGLGCG